MADAEYRIVIKELPEGERPRERLGLYGESALSNADLLAIALRTGSKRENALGLAQRLLVTFQGLVGLARASVQELCVVPGIGPAKAAQVKAAIELGRRLSLAGDDGRLQISSPDDAAAVFMDQMASEMQEQLRVMLLDTKHRVMRTSVVYMGNVNSSVVRAGEVFREAVKDNATAIIVAHNHPSGDPTPSIEDVEVTGALAQAGRLLDIKLLDHLIVARRGHVSLKARNPGAF